MQYALLLQYIITDLIIIFITCRKQDIVKPHIKRVAKNELDSFLIFIQ